MRSVRQYWRGIQGRVPLNFNWDAVNSDSTVHVTASEFSLDGANPSASPRFVGASTITVRNVTPHGPPYDPNHGVTFVVDVDWPEPLNIVTDIILIEAAEYVDVGWRRLAFAMQTQQQTNWCWCANAVSIDAFYGGNLTQGAFADQHLGQTTCTVNGASAACNVQSDMVSPLRELGRLNTWRASAPTFAEIQTEIDSNRPVSTRIQWSGGGGHFVSVTGYLANTEFISVQDPGGTQSDIRLSTFLSAYNGTGTVDETHFTTT